MFHVEPTRFQSLADAELAEDDVEDVLYIDPAKQATKRGGVRAPQLLAGMFLALPDHVDTALETPQPPPRPRCRARLITPASLVPKIVVRETDQCGD